MKRLISVHTEIYLMQILVLKVDFAIPFYTRTHTQLYFLCISDAVAESIVFTVNITLRPMRRMQAPFNLIRDITVNVLVPDRRRPHFYVEAFHECAFSCRKSGLGPRYRDRPIFIAIYAIRFLCDFHISKLNVSAFLSKHFRQILCILIYTLIYSFRFFSVSDIFSLKRSTLFRAIHGT